MAMRRHIVTAKRHPASEHGFGGVEFAKLQIGPAFLRQAARPRVGVRFVPEPPDHPPHHLPRGFIREGEQENAFGWDALLQQKRHAIGQRPGFSGARTRHDHDRPFGLFYGSPL